MEIIAIYAIAIVMLIIMLFVPTALIIGLIILISKKDSSKKGQKEKNLTKTKKNNYKNSYEPRYLLSINEKDQYRKIYEWSKKHNLIVFTKVRLLDLITPRNNQENYNHRLGKIKSKHVDFVVCDQNIRVKCIIEISDNSHKREDRAERDMFVEDVLEACGYKLLTTYNVTEEQLNKICGYNKSPIEEQKTTVTVSSEQDRHR